MVENISTFAQWDEQVVDLGKTVTLTINGVGRVVFQDNSGDFYIEIDGPVESRKVNMPPDAYIGKRDIDPDFEYTGITLNGEPYDIDYGTVNNNDIVVVTWTQSVQRPPVVSGETWLSFVRPGDDTYGNPMNVVLINKETHDNESTWIKNIECFTSANREYSIHVPDGVYYVLPPIYYTGTAYRTLIPKKLTISSGDTGGYKVVRMEWLPIKRPNENMFDWKQEYDKIYNFIGLIAVFDEENMISNDSFNLDVMDIDNQSPNKGYSSSIYFDYVKPGDEYDDESLINSCFRADNFREYGFTSEFKYRFSISRDGQDPAMEYDYPNTLGCLYLNNKAHFIKPHKGGGIIDIEPPLSLDDNGAVTAAMIWFHHTAKVYR